MVDVSGIPNMGFGGGAYFADPFSGLANAYASQAQTNNWNAQQANTLAQANSFNPWANSGGRFGAMTDYYSRMGAASLGGSSPRHRLARIMAPQSSPFTSGAPPHNSYGGFANPGAFSRSPNYPGTSPSQPDFNDFFQSRGGNIPPRQVPSPYGPGGYPPMEPATPGQQGQNWYGQPTATS